MKPWFEDFKELVRSDKVLKMEAEGGAGGINPDALMKMLGGMLKK